MFEEDNGKKMSRVEKDFTEALVFEQANEFAEAIKRYRFLISHYPRRSRASRNSTRLDPGNSHRGIQSPSLGIAGDHDKSHQEIQIPHRRSTRCACRRAGGNG